MHFYVAVFSAGTAVELLINMVAAIALYMKVQSDQPAMYSRSHYMSFIMSLYVHVRVIILFRAAGVSCCRGSSSTE